MSSQTSAIEFISQQFCEAFSSVFEQTAGEPYVLERSNSKSSEEGAEQLEYTLAFSGTVNGRIIVQAKLDTVAVLATRLMGMSEGDAVEYLPEHADAMLEIVSQTGGLMATTIRTSFGDVKINAGVRNENAVVPGVVILLKSASSNAPASIELLCEDALIESITANLASKQHAATPKEPAAAPPVMTPERQNLQLIMDVELNLTLRFGQRTLMLSEVADLTSGSVIELDRLVDDPVELLLGDRVIARGEVVIVDGNYGLRVSDLTPIDHNYILPA